MALEDEPVVGNVLEDPENSGGEQVARGEQQAPHHVGGVHLVDRVGGQFRDGQGDCEAEPGDEHVQRRLADYPFAAAALPRPAAVEHPVGDRTRDKGDHRTGTGAPAEPVHAGVEHDPARKVGHHRAGAVAPEPDEGRCVPAPQPVRPQQPVAEAAASVDDGVRSDDDVVGYGGAVGRRRNQRPHAVGPRPEAAIRIGYGARPTRL